MAIFFTIRKERIYILRMSIYHRDHVFQEYRITSKSRFRKGLYEARSILMSHKCRVIRNDCRGFNNLPPRSPDATPCDFFLWGYFKDQVYVPPLHASIPELKVRIKTAIQTITVDIRQTVWNELNYSVDDCGITKGLHIEKLLGM